MLEQAGGGSSSTVASVSLQRPRSGWLPSMGTRERSDPSSRTMAERFREVVAKHLVAWLPGGAVGSRGISDGFDPDDGRVTRKRGVVGGYGQRRGRFTARIMIAVRHTDYF